MDLFLNSSRKEREDIPIGSRPSRNTCSKALVHTANSTRDDESKWMKNPQIQRLQAKGVSVARRKRQAETKAMAAKEGATGTVFVQLRSLELWQMFYRQETEMIITKAGRRMFPVPDFSLSGLEPDQYYSCAVEIVPVDIHRYRYKTSEGWVPAGKGGVLVDQQHCRYLHPNSASLGHFWMTQGATFDKLKLSNHIIPNSDNVVVNSLQKYKLRFVLTKLGVRHCNRWVFNFSETQFITVTSYQNPRMTQLKIDNNPFAKAFREGKRTNRGDGTHTESKAKRRRTRFPSPPPIIRYQPPFINFLSSQEQPPVTSAPLPPPPPPPPPLSHDWPEEPCLTRNIPVQHELPFLWERDDLSQMTSLSSMSSSFKLELNGTLQWRDNCGLQQFEPLVEEFQPHFPAPCWSSTHPGYGLFEDLQTQHYASRDQYWRES